MNWTRLKFWNRGSPFSRPKAVTVPLEVNGRMDIRLSPANSVFTADSTPIPGPERKASAGSSRWSWLGWLAGRNRRRDNADRWVQGELLLRQVRPLRNDFRDESDSASGRRNPKVLYETPPTPERRDDQDHAWNRLRNRRSATVVTPGD